MRPSAIALSTNITPKAFLDNASLFLEKASSKLAYRSLLLLAGERPEDKENAELFKQKLKEAPEPGWLRSVKVTMIVEVYDTPPPLEDDK